MLFDIGLGGEVCALLDAILVTLFSTFMVLLRFKNVIFEISPSETVGVFDVKAKLMGVHLETLQLEYQVFIYYSVTRHLNLTEQSRLVATAAES